MDTSRIMVVICKFSASLLLEGNTTQYVHYFNCPLPEEPLVPAVAHF
jgi:hypothetical protein